MSTTNEEQNKQSENTQQEQTNSQGPKEPECTCDSCALDHITHTEKQREDATEAVRQIFKDRQDAFIVMAVRTGADEERYVSACAIGNNIQLRALISTVIDEKDSPMKRILEQGLAKNAMKKSPVFNAFKDFLSELANEVNKKEGEDKDERA